MGEGEGHTYVVIKTEVGEEDEEIVLLFEVEVLVCGGNGVGKGYLLHVCWVAGWLHIGVKVEHRYDGYFEAVGHSELLVGLYVNVHFGWGAHIGTEKVEVG